MNYENDYSNYLNKLLTTIIMFNPENTSAFYKTPHFQSDVFQFSKQNDFAYESKTIALLTVCYYAVKNRCFNYVFKGNCSLQEIMYTEDMRLYLEENAQTIIGQNKRIEKMFARLMVLIYDKMLSSKIEIFCKGERTPDGFVGFNVGHTTFGNITYKNTSKTIYVLGMQAIMISDKKQEFIDRRNFWAKICDLTDIENCKNTFLYNCYDIIEINKFLSQNFNFELKPIKTKWYKDYVANWNRRELNRTSFIKIIKSLVMQAKGDWDGALSSLGAGTPAEQYTFFEEMLSILKTLLPVSPLIFLLEILEGKLKIAIGILTVILWVFLYMFGSKLLEKKKRKTFSLLKGIIN